MQRADGARREARGVRPEPGAAGVSGGGVWSEAAGESGALRAFGAEPGVSDAADGAGRGQAAESARGVWSEAAGERGAGRGDAASGVWREAPGARGAGRGVTAERGESGGSDAARERGAGGVPGDHGTRAGTGASGVWREAAVQRGVGGATRREGGTVDGTRDAAGGAALRGRALSRGKRPVASSAATTTDWQSEARASASVRAVLVREARRSDSVSAVLVREELGTDLVSALRPVPARGSANPVPLSSELPGGTQRSSPALARLRRHSRPRLLALWRPRTRR